MNARFLDIKIRQPFGAATDDALRRQVESRVGRGRVDLRVSLESGVVSHHAGGGDDERALGMVGVRVDALARGVAAASIAAKFASEAGLEVLPVNPLELLSFSARLPDPNAVSGQTAPDSLVAVVDAALDQLVEARVFEGEVLTRELDARLGELEQTSRRLRESIEGEADRLRDALQARIAELVPRHQAGSLDAQRIAQEVAMVVAKGDVAEELARLDSHFEQFRAILSAEASTGQGKRLDFLAQELLREVTTIGSKISSHAGSALVIEAKATVERIREQVQNVE